ncbi:MAG: MFS transporter [Chloroflexota bacterium]
MLNNFRQTLATFNRNVRLYLLTSLLLGLSVDGVYAVLFNLFLLRLGYDPKIIGYINSAGLFTFAFTSLPAGLLGSRFGSRRMLMVGVIAVLSGGTWVPLAQSVPPAWEQTWIMLGYMLLMGGFAIFFVNGSPFMMGTAAEGQRNQVFATQAAFNALAGFGGSLLGGALPGVVSRFLALDLTNPEPYRYPMQVLVFLMIPAYFLIRATEEPRADLAERDAKQGQHKERETAVSLSRQERSRLFPLWGRFRWSLVVGIPRRLPKPKLALASLKQLPLLLILLLAVIRLMQVAGLGTTATFINVYLDTELQVSTARIGLLTSVSRLVGVPAALLVPSLTKRFGNMNVAIAGSLGAALCILPIALVPHWLVAGLGFVGARIMTSLRYPAFQVYSLELVEPKLQSMLAGVMGLAAGLSFALMAFFGGFVITASSFQTLFLIGSTITLVGTAVLWLFHMSRRTVAVEVAGD